MKWGENMEFQKFRTINSAYAEIKKQDPETEISMHGIRAGIKQGFIPSVKIGNKVVVSIESILKFYSGEAQQQKALNKKYGEIRTIY